MTTETATITDNDRKNNGKKTTKTTALTATTGLPRNFFKISRNDGGNGKRQQQERQRQRQRRTAKTTTKDNDNKRQLQRQRGKRIYFFKWIDDFVFGYIKRFQDFKLYSLIS